MSLLGFLAAHSKLFDQIGIDALLALSLSLSLRAGQLALAQAAFMGIAAYVGSIGSLVAHWNLAESLIAGPLAAALVAALLALPIGRLQGVFLAIATVAFGEIARIVEINLPITGGAEGLSNIPNDAGTFLIYAMLLACAGGVWALQAGSRSFALAMAATREDEHAARTIGIDVARVRILTLVLGAAIAGIAGVLYAHANFFITPEDFGFTRMEQILVSCVIGGVTSSLGAIFGSAFLTVLPETIRFLHQYREVSIGVILLAVILFAPSGIAGLWKRR
ncbi:MAG TPA: branched-chain amino acid ABC transporter permease [Candidatus Baltobacteraceae bacterium]|nr:branched-chain amino acid ABC transporter permease [Candidatus Baltobacteraceae bacterium]